ncbi:hypothetical protein JCM10908_006625 [Rhodotorula pacifica]|uniref:uncharacterized protein n=1 Tax=Rhodotorula pacifica TaxID=1495444 RepID=UPI00317F47CA
MKRRKSATVQGQKRTSSAAATGDQSAPNAGKDGELTEKAYTFTLADDALLLALWGRACVSTKSHATGTSEPEQESPQLDWHKIARLYFNHSRLARALSEQDLQERLNHMLGRRVWLAERAKALAELEAAVSEAQEKVAVGQAPANSEANAVAGPSGVGKRALDDELDAAGNGQDNAEPPVIKRLKGSKWSEREKEVLSQIVNQPGGHPAWDTVADLLAQAGFEGRTGRACKDRARALRSEPVKELKGKGVERQPPIQPEKLAPFSQAEDDKLLAMYESVRDLLKQNRFAPKSERLNWTTTSSEFPRSANCADTRDRKELQDRLTWLTRQEVKLDKANKRREEENKKLDEANKAREERIQRVELIKQEIMD